MGRGGVVMLSPELLGRGAAWKWNEWIKLRGGGKLSCQCTLSSQFPCSPQPQGGPQILAAVQWQICAGQQGEASLQMLISALNYILHTFYQELYCHQLQRFAIWSKLKSIDPLVPAKSENGRTDPRRGLLIWKLQTSLRFSGGLPASPCY